MAITKLLRLKESAKGNKAAHLKHNLFYICDPDKCGGGVWIGGNAGTRPEIIYETMIENKKYWGKEDGSQGFHYVISFPPELHVSEELAYQIAQDFAAELLGDRFYYAFAVHNDQHHMHVHITFDSVSKEDGYKFHSPKGDWERRIQPITDKICQKYHLPILEFTDEKKGKSYGQWKDDKEQETKRNPGDVSWYDLIRDDIDQAIMMSDTFTEVLSYLKDHGYEVRLGKYLSLKPYGRERAVRSSRLGRGYTIDEIKERILFKDKDADPKRFIRYGLPDEIIAVFKIRREKDPNWKMTPFQRRYYQRWHNSFLRNKPGRDRPWKTNADVVRIRRLSNAVKFMVDSDIRDFEALEEKWKDLQTRREAIDEGYKHLRSKRYKGTLRDLSRYEKLAGKSKADLSPDEEKELSVLLERISQNGGLENARALFDETTKQMEMLREEKKSLSREEKLLNDLYTFYFDMPIPEKEKAEKEKSWEMERTRITAYKTLIIRKDPDGYLIKIPGRDEMVKLGSDDTFLYKSGEILSAFLYDDEEYEIYDLAGKEIRKAAGSEMKSFFTKQKDRMRQKVR